MNVKAYPPAKQTERQRVPFSSRQTKRPTKPKPKGATVTLDFLSRALVELAAKYDGTSDVVATIEEMELELEAVQVVKLLMRDNAHVVQLLIRETGRELEAGVTAEKIAPVVTLQVAEPGEGNVTVKTLLNALRAVVTAWDAIEPIGWASRKQGDPKKLVEAVVNARKVLTTIDGK